MDTYHRTGWVAALNVSGGQDHLGTQAPCVLIYAQLLPGITNVTDRARYFSFYTWLIWSFRQRFPGADRKRFVELFRRADCLFTLIAARHDLHGVEPEIHGAATAGTQKLNRAARQLGPGASIHLDDHTTMTESSGSRYFKNELGGYGQYYAGTLMNLGLLDGAKYPNAEPFGATLAEAFASSVPGSDFWNIVDSGTASAADLERLRAFCPCHLTKAEHERDALLDIFFDRSKRYGPEGVQRKASLALFLHAAKALNARPGEDLNIKTFRAAAYTRTLPGALEWRPPAALEETARHWAYYVRSDTLSIVMLEAFAIALEDLEADQERPTSIAEHARRLVRRSEVAEAIDQIGSADFASLCGELRRSAPALQDFEDPNHEIAWSDAALQVENRARPSLPTRLAGVVRMLATLHVRDDLAAEPFGSLPIGHHDVVDSPINLSTFRSRCTDWGLWSLDVVAIDVLVWCMETHLRVALRKLREGGKDTFQFYPSERGLERHRPVPAPSQTTPRFKQAIQILRDLDTLAKSSPTPRGNELMEKVIG